MSNILDYIIISGIAYIIGCINPAIIIARLHGVDIRKEGSGNPGMTNTIRVIGLKAGIAVFVTDFLKGFVAVMQGYFISDGDILAALLGFAFVVLGHCYPGTYNFKGGKGVSASLGAAFALNWTSALGVLAVAGVLFLASGRKMSLASLGAAISYPAFIWFMMPGDRRCFVFAIIAALFLIIQHAANIGRIARGEEESLTIGHGTTEHTEERDK